MARLLRGFWAADSFPERARGEDKRTAARHRRPAGLGCTVMDVAGAAADMADWRELTQGAPELARLGLARLHAAGLVMLGTLRRDGSPRISPVEPCITDGRLLVGAMTWSGKAADLRRDPRRPQARSGRPPTPGRYRCVICILKLTRPDRIFAPCSGQHCAAGAAPNVCSADKLPRLHDVRTMKFTSAVPLAMIRPVSPPIFSPNSTEASSGDIAPKA